MEILPVYQFLVISGSCCNPALGKMDQTLEKSLEETISKLGLSAEIKKISLTSVLHHQAELTWKQQSLILNLFNKYGTKFTPALMVNDEIMFAGKTPSTEELSKIIAEKLKK